MQDVMRKRFTSSPETRASPGKWIIRFSIYVMLFISLHLGKPIAFCNFSSRKLGRALKGDVRKSEEKVSFCRKATPRTRASDKPTKPTPS